MPFHVQRDHLRASGRPILKVLRYGIANPFLLHETESYDLADGFVYAIAIDGLISARRGEKVAVSARLRAREKLTVRR